MTEHDSIRLFKKCRQALVDFTTQVDLIDEVDEHIRQFEAELPQPRKPRGESNGCWDCKHTKKEDNEFPCNSCVGDIEYWEPL